VIIVNGATGFIGRLLLPGLAQSGYTGIAVSRNPHQKAPAGWSWTNRSELLTAGECVSFKTVIHLEVKQHIQNPTATDLEDFHKVNVDGTQEWLDWASRNGVRRFVFFSSIKAVGDSPHCQDESGSSPPNTPYGQSKRAAEERVRAWAAASPDRSALILRPAVVYGPGNQANMLSLVEAIDRRRFFLIGRNENVKSLISLKNLVAAVQHLIERPLRGAEVYYLTDLESYSVAHIARMIGEIFGRERGIPSLPSTLARGAAVGGDLFTRITGKNFPLTSSRLKALLETTHFSSAKLQSTGFVHPQTTRDGLKEMVDWYLTQKSTPKPSSR
jgi:nucleoside-diphosphate-sugar epimerase